jgi:hypothetical protein
VVSDLTQALTFIKDRNASARFIVTVSPVPLKATAAPKSVLVSTTLSKAILRVAAEVVTSSRPDAAYFPSYEIITGAHARGAYFESDLRSVTDAGVAHVMRLFLAHYTEGGHSPELTADVPTSPSASYIEKMRQTAAVICEEELLDQDKTHAQTA